MTSTQTHTALQREYNQQEKCRASLCHTLKKIMKNEHLHHRLKLGHRALGEVHKGKRHQHRHTWTDTYRKKGNINYIQKFRLGNGAL